MEEVVSQCRSCGAEIKWLELKSGKKMPVNLPAITGFSDRDTVIKVWPDGLTEVKNGTKEDEYCTYYVAHFFTCPHADDWRSKPEGKAKRVLREEAEKQKSLEWSK